MKIAFSPCPNDTFVFHAWVHGLIPGAPKLDVTYADIDITNSLAASPGGPEVLENFLCGFAMGAVGICIAPMWRSAWKRLRAAGIDS